MQIISHVKNWYTRYERPISSAALLGGFVFNALVLKRVDLFWENFWVVIHLVVIAACIVVINLRENEDHTETGTLHFWLITILQFTFGGLLSTYLVFYFRSSTLAVAWPFILLLTLAFIANERLKHHYSRLTFQISLLYLSIFSFAIFIIPVFLHQIGPSIFLLSGVASLGVLGLFLFALKYLAREKFKENRKMLALYIGGIFLAVNILYFFNFIPPIPLSLKDAGVYHSVLRTTTGDYVVTAEDTSWLKRFFSNDVVHVVAGDPIYAYSALFSPAAFHTIIVHEWQWHDPSTGKWLTINRVELGTFGGREGGYRTYSLISSAAVGDWRVNVETENGQIIGRIRFSVISVAVEPRIHSEIKQ